MRSFISFCTLLLLAYSIAFWTTNISAQQNAASGMHQAGAAAAKGSTPSDASFGIGHKTEFHEDFSSLSLPAGIQADAPLLGEESKLREFSRELVRVQWRDLDPIDLWVIKPTGVKRPPVILYLYSFPSDNTRYYSPEFCRGLTHGGFAAVGFVSAFTGERYHDHPQRKWFISELQESLGSSVHDVQMILNYLASRGDLDMDHIGIWGDGSGASIAIMAAAVDSRIKALDLLDPWGDWPDWLSKSTLVPENERADYLKPDFLDKVANLDPAKWLSQLKTEHIRLQYIENGISVTPGIARLKVEASAGTRVQLVRYRDSKEFFSQVATTGTGFDWIKERLGKGTVRAQSEGRQDKASPEILASGETSTRPDRK